MSKKSKIMGKNNAYLPNLTPYFQADVNLKTGLPNRLFYSSDDNLKLEITKLLEVIDLQDYVNRGKWFNLPEGIDSQELERMMYLKGQLCIFYDESTQKFWFMPFALDGGLDFYQRFKVIHPVPLYEATSDNEYDKVEVERLRQLLSTMKKKVEYDVVAEEELDYERMTNTAVILRDYTPKTAQTVLPRCTLQKPLIDQEADFFCYTRTAGLIALAIKGMRVSDGDQAKEVMDAACQYKDMALKGIPWTALISQIEFQDLATSTGVKPEEFLLVLQSFDNLRLRALGINNGGLFEKKAHELQKEAAINGGPIEMEAQDWVSRRQHFCNVVNSIWGLGIWYEPSENLLEQDTNQDGAIYDTDSEMNDTSYQSEGGSEE